MAVSSHGIQGVGPDLHPAVGTSKVCDAICGTDPPQALAKRVQVWGGVEGLERLGLKRGLGPGGRSRVGLEIK